MKVSKRKLFSVVTCLLVIGFMLLPCLALAQNTINEEPDTQDVLGDFILSLPKPEPLIEAEPQAPPANPRLIAYIKKFKASDKHASNVISSSKKYSKEFGVPLNLIMAIATKESGFRQFVKSKDGSCGILQVREKVHMPLLRSLGVKDIYVVDDNIHVGVLLLKGYLVKSKGSIPLALKKYSGGSSKYALSVMQIMKSIPT